jgi:hypothetical protein
MTKAAIGPEHKFRSITNRRMIGSVASAAKGRLWHWCTADFGGEFPGPISAQTVQKARSQ